MDTHIHFDYALATNRNNILFRATLKAVRPAPKSHDTTDMGMLLAKVIHGEDKTTFQRSFFNQKIYDIPEDGISTENYVTLGVNTIGDRMNIDSAIKKFRRKESVSLVKDRDLPIYKVDGNEKTFEGSSEGFHCYKDWIIREALFIDPELTEADLCQQALGDAPIRRHVDGYILRLLQRTTSLNAYDIVTKQDNQAATSGIIALLQLTKAYGQVNVQQRLAYHKKAQEYNPEDRTGAELLADLRQIGETMDRYPFSTLMLQAEKAMVALRKTGDDDNLATELGRLAPEELTWQKIESIVRDSTLNLRTTDSPSEPYRMHHIRSANTGQVIRFGVDTYAEISAVQNKATLWNTKDATGNLAGVSGGSGLGITGTGKLQGKAGKKLISLGNAFVVPDCNVNCLSIPQTILKDKTVVSLYVSEKESYLLVQNNDKKINGGRNQKVTLSLEDTGLYLDLSVLAPSDRGSKKVK